ncbi:MAG: hypothetical protein LBK41_05975 [Clostridiales bacterium]|nr:hypothetical protein [Clostridiales bacterium]
MKKVRETSKPSPFNYSENSFLYISGNMPFPDDNNGAYIDAIADEAKRLIAAANGHAAMLFTSFKVMDKVFERLSGEIPFPVFKLGKSGGKSIDRFKKSGGVLLSAGSLWEGIDIPGDALSLLIIVRLPFAVPDPFSEWERTLYGNFDDYKNSVIAPDMLVKLKQGFGRLIRTETDTGVVAILDRRASSRGTYRAAVLNALPKCRVTSSAGEVRQFMESVKDAQYFKKQQ